MWIFYVLLEKKLFFIIYLVMVQFRFFFSSLFTAIMQTDFMIRCGFLVSSKTLYGMRRDDKMFLHVKDTLMKKRWTKNDAHNTSKRMNHIYQRIEMSTLNNNLFLEKLSLSEPTTTCFVFIFRVDKKLAEWIGNLFLLIQISIGNCKTKCHTELSTVLATFNFLR